MTLRMAAVCVAAVVTTGGVAGQRPECTLEPTEGSRQVPLLDNVTATMAWSTCTSMVKDIIFEWPRKQGMPGTSRAALTRAAALVREWERVTKDDVSPFGDLPNALDTRAAAAEPYEFGEDIPVTDYGFRGWDGAWVLISSTPELTRLTVHYWANP
jgi:hypothetical protein